MEKKYINKDNHVYFSYAWADGEHPDIEEDVDKLCKILDDNNIKYKRDKENLCDYRSNIQESEEKIGGGSAIIVVISEKYLKSEHCMNEWHLIRENGKIWERVYPIVMENANISNDEIYEKYYQFFDIDTPHFCLKRGMQDIYGVCDGNRTRITSLGRWSVAITPRRHFPHA